MSPERPSDRPAPTPTTPARGPSNPDDFDAQVRGVAALGEPIRRALYRYVVAQPEPVGRDAAAAALGIARHTAKFHLDKLVDDGLLAIEFARPAGRGGPGAGRPAKLYRRSARELAVTLPERHYELAGRLLARAVTDAERGDAPVSAALARVAHDAGRSIGEASGRRVAKRAKPAEQVAATASVLRECGYEPRTDASGMTLANCPFHALAQEFTELVCGMNLELIDGVLDGMGDSSLEARLEPVPGQCCVRIQARDARA